MSALERLQVMLASYFEFFGVKVADMLATFSGIDQRRITQLFMDIIEGDLYHEDETGATVITIDLPDDIGRPVLLFVNLYVLDKKAEEATSAMLEYFVNINK